MHHVLCSCTSNVNIIHKDLFLDNKTNAKIQDNETCYTYSKNSDCCCSSVNFDFSYDSILPSKNSAHLQSSLDKSCTICIIPQTQFNRPEVRDLIPQEKHHITNTGTKISKIQIIKR